MTDDAVCNQLQWDSINVSYGDQQELMGNVVIANNITSSCTVASFKSLEMVEAQLQKHL